MQATVNPVTSVSRTTAQPATPTSHTGNGLVAERVLGVMAAVRVVWTAAGVATV